MSIVFVAILICFKILVGAAISSDFTDSCFDYKEKNGSFVVLEKHLLVLAA